MLHAMPTVRQLQRASVASLSKQRGRSQRGWEASDANNPHSSLGALIATNVFIFRRGHGNTEYSFDFKLEIREGAWSGGLQPGAPPGPYVKEVLSIFSTKTPV